MIWFIAGSALFLIMMFNTVFFQEISRYTVATETLRLVSQIASEDGAMFYNLDAYSEGDLVFNYNESLKSIRFSIVDNLNINSDLSPTSTSYWPGNLSYTVTYYDDLGKHVYVDGGLTSFTPEMYPCTFTDSSTGYTKDIFEPSVIVKIESPDIVIRNIETRNVPLKRTAITELKAR